MQLVIPTFLCGLNDDDRSDAIELLNFVVRQLERGAFPQRDVVTIGELKCVAASNAESVPIAPNILKEVKKILRERGFPQYQDDPDRSGAAGEQ